MYQISYTVLLILKVHDYRHFSVSTRDRNGNGFVVIKTQGQGTEGVEEEGWEGDGTGRVVGVRRIGGDKREVGWEGRRS